MASARIRKESTATMKMRTMFALLCALSLPPATGCDDGVSDQRRPIGASCATSGQCGTGKYFCDVAAPDGDCEAECRGDGDCPTGAVCVGGGIIMTGACLLQCTTIADCRAGYVCAPADDASHAHCAAPPASDGGVDAL